MNRVPAGDKNKRGIITPQYWKLMITEWESKNLNCLSRIDCSKDCFLFIFLRNHLFRHEPSPTWREERLFFSFQLSRALDFNNQRRNNTRVRQCRNIAQRWTWSTWMQKNMSPIWRILLWDFSLRPGLAAIRCVVHERVSLCCSYAWRSVLAEWKDMPWRLAPLWTMSSYPQVS